MTTNNTNKNERTTKINGFRIEINDGVMSNEPFTIELEYVRSTDKARKMCAKYFNVDQNFIVISSIENKPIVPTNYDAQSLIDFCEWTLEDKETAQESANDNDKDCVVVPFDIYEYSGYVWMCDETETEYRTEFIVERSTVKHSAIDRRGFLRMIAEDSYIGYKVLAIHNDARMVAREYVVITRENLKQVKTRD